MLWEALPGPGDYDEKLWSAAIPVIGRLGDPDSARALLYLAEKAAL